jgi:hypothetical protein
VGYYAFIAFILRRNKSKDDRLVICVALVHLSYLKPESATFQLPRAALAMHTFAEGSRKILIMLWTVSENVFLKVKVYSWYSLENGQ